MPEYHLVNALAHVGIKLILAKTFLKYTTELLSFSVVPLWTLNSEEFS